MIWENYFIKESDEFHSFWNEYLGKQDRNILFIMGMGFDPRTNDGIKAIYSIPSNGLRSTTILRYYATEEEATVTPMPIVQYHINSLESFLQENELENFKVKALVQRSFDDKSVASINATQLFSYDDILAYSDVIVDISAMPRGVFLPLLNKLLFLINDWNKQCPNIRDKKNLHVVVTENPTLDSKIYDRGEAYEANYIHGLAIIDTAKTRNYEEVWITLLGERQTKQYETVRKNIDPAEVCPVLPFPSKDMKRSDRLIIEYQDLLFNDESFDAKNIIYADEQNPFQVYRLIYKAIERYDKSLKILNGCKVIISVFSSKLLTVGAFLAVFESRLEDKNVGIKHVETLGQELDENSKLNLDEILASNNLVEIWLAGMPYE